MSRRSRKPSRLQLARAEGRPLDESVASNLRYMALAAEALAAGLDMAEKHPEKFSIKFSKRSSGPLDTEGGDMIQYGAKS